MLARAAVVVLSCVGVLAGCGGSAPHDQPVRGVRTAPRPHGPLDVPAGVPLTGSGAADPAQAKVIRAWADALRGGDISAATALWAVPATIQNGTPVLRLRSTLDIRRFNLSLPCGAVVTRTEKGTAGFTIATFRLTDRKGGDCGSGVGGHARTAIRVTGGRIAEWYRLPEPGQTPAPGLAPGSESPPV